MPVLIEGISVIVRKDRLDEVAGGWKRFVNLVSNATLCHDDKIARVGFLSPAETEVFVKELRQEFAPHLFGGYLGVDMAVADQQSGITSDCDWLDFMRLPVNDNGDMVSTCWFVNRKLPLPGLSMPQTDMQISAPEEWKYEGSLSQSFTVSGKDVER